LPSLSCTPGKSDPFREPLERLLITTSEGHLGESSPLDDFHEGTGDPKPSGDLTVGKRFAHFSSLAVSSYQRMREEG